MHVGLGIGGGVGEDENAVVAVAGVAHLGFGENMRRWHAA